MPTVPSRLAALALFAALLAPLAARAQGGLPGMPTPEEIERRIAAELEKIPAQTVTDEVFEISYKPVPLDVNEIARRAAAAGGQLPPGMTPEQAAKQVLPLARPYIERAYGEIGTLRVRRAVTWRSVRLEPNEYLLGLLMRGTQPVGLRITGAALKKEVRIPLRPARSPSPHPALKLEVEIADKRQGKRYIVASFNAVRARAGAFVPAPARDGGKKTR